LASALINHTVEEAKKSSLPVIEYYSNRQRGDSFGERLANAIEHTFACGYENIIVTGTDTPLIHSSQFVDISGRLIKSQLVLAPSCDGGVYLIGINKAAYHRQNFCSIPWLTGSVFSSLVTYTFKVGATLSISALKKDIDNITDVLAWRSEYPGNNFGFLITQLLTGLRKQPSIIYSIIFLLQIFSYTPDLRGPPKFTN
jgi:glycosyltransferase A (GT-A) superfamily protein (DUF2064 family)